MTDLSPVLTGITAARGLPNAHYTDDSVHAVERERLLFANWSGLTFASEVPEPGDALPLDFMGLPLLVVRDKAGVVRVFQNTCRHRGMILVSERRKIGGVIRCPYHSWCYALTGDLVTTPHIGGPGQNIHPDVKRAELGLVEIRSHVWHDVVFVNVSGTAPPFEDYAAPAIARWSEFENRDYVFAGPESAFALEAACNWKLAVENYCESYHLPWVHPGLNSYSRLEDHYNIEEEGHFSGQGTRVYRPTLSDDGRRFPDYPNLSDKWEAGAEYIALYPNVLFGVHRDHAFAILLLPQARDRTREEVRIHYAADEVAQPEWAALRERNAAMWKTVFEEDLFVVEGMQKGRHGVHFDGGRFSPVMDGPTHLFHKWVAERMRETVDAGRPDRPHV